MLRASICSRVTVSTTPGVSGANAGAARAAVTLTACNVFAGSVNEFAELFVTEGWETEVSDAERSMTARSVVLSSAQAG
ncbi:hypothetical protein PTKU46_07230 [Paraburkholderia terrae]